LVFRPAPFGYAKQQSRGDTVNPRRPGTLHFIAWYFIAWVLVSLFTTALLSPSPVAAEPGQFVVSPVAEKRLDALPPGPLYWRIENFPALDATRPASVPAKFE
jgi:hypothetical protein